MLSSARFWVLVSGLVLTVLLAPLLPNWQVNAQEGQPSLSEFEQAASEVGKEFQESKQEELDVQLNPNISQEEKVDKLTEIRRAFIDEACKIIGCDPQKLGGTPATPTTTSNLPGGSKEDSFKLFNQAVDQCIKDGGSASKCNDEIGKKYEAEFQSCLERGGSSDQCSTEANNKLIGVKIEPSKSPSGMKIEGVDCAANSANSEACESYIKNMTNACNSGNKDGCTGRDGACKGFEDYCNGLTQLLPPSGISQVKPPPPCDAACEKARAHAAFNDCTPKGSLECALINPDPVQRNQSILQYNYGVCQAKNSNDPDCEQYNPERSPEERQAITQNIDEREKAKQAVREKEQHEQRTRDYNTCVGEGLADCDQHLNYTPPQKVTEI